MYATRRQTDDRRQELALEREKWEHERDSSLRERRRTALANAIGALEGLGDFLFEAHKDRSRLDAFVGEFHEARVVAGAAHRAALDLGHHGLSEGALVNGVLDLFGKTVRDFTDGTYHDFYESQRVATEALRAKLADIP